MNWEYWMGIPADGVPLAEHCTGSPTCQCSDCRLSEHNAGEALIDQLPRGYTYESPEIRANREAGLYAMVDPLPSLSELEQKVTDLEERLRNATIVINGQVDSIEMLYEQQNSQNERLMSIEQLLSTWTTK